MDEAVEKRTFMYRYIIGTTLLEKKLAELSSKIENKHTI